MFNSNQSFTRAHGKELIDCESGARVLPPKLLQQHKSTSRCGQGAQKHTDALTLPSNQGRATYCFKRGLSHSPAHDFSAKISTFFIDANVFAAIKHSCRLAFRVVPVLNSIDSQGFRIEVKQKTGTQVRRSWSSSLTVAFSV